MIFLLCYITGLIPQMEAWRSDGRSSDDTAKREHPFYHSDDDENLEDIVTALIAQGVTHCV